VDNETGAPVSGAVLNLTSPGETVSSGSNTDTTDANGYYEIDAYFEPGDPGDTWTLKVEHDAYFSQNVSISGDGEVTGTYNFSLVKRLSTNNIHFVNSTNMESDTYYRGENVFIWISLNDEDGNPLSGQNVYFTDPNGNLILMNDNSDGTYSYTYHINYNDPLGTWTVEFFQDNAKLNEVNLTILPINLAIIFNQPSQGDEFNRGETIPIDVSITYPDGTDVDTGSVNATINGDVVTLTNPNNDSEWVGSYTIPSSTPEGSLSIDINADDGFDNTGSNSTTVDVNATLFVNITSPDDGDTFSKGQVVTVTAEVRDINNNLLSGASVVANGPNTGNSFVLLEVSQGIYSADYHTSSSNPSGAWTINVDAQNSGNSGSDSVSVNLENPASLTLTLSTNLSRHEYCNKGQTYELYVDVTNGGEATAENVAVSLTSSMGSSVTPSTVQLGNISSGASQVATFMVTCAQTLGVDNLTATASGTDENSGDVVSASNSIGVIIQQGAGGDDGELELNGSLGSGVWINPNLINAQGMQAEVNVVVANDGDVPANSTSITATIHEGSCAGNDVTNSFTLTPYVPASADIDSGSTQTYTFNISTTSASSGNYVVCVTASGTDANSGETVSSSLGYETFVLDADGPFFSNEHVIPASGTEYDANGQYTFYINWTDVSGINDVVLEFNGQNYTLSNGDINVSGDEYSITFSSLNAGTYYYKWYAVDSVNNWNSTQQLQYEIAKKTIYDPTDPINSLVHLAINGNEANFTADYGTQTNASGWKDATITDGDLYLFLNGTLVNNPDVETLDAGVYEYKFIFNNSQNYADAEIIRTVTISKAYPILTLTIDGIDGDTTAEAYEGVEINLTSTVNKYAEIYVNGTLIDSGDTPLSTTQTFSVGTYNITAAMPETNNYHEVSESHILTVVDTTAPQITLTSPAEGSQEGPSVTFNFTATDTVSTTLYCELVLNDSVAQADNITSGANSSWQVSGLTLGNYEWHVNCTDDAGNEGRSALRHFDVVDTTSPDVNITSPQDNDYLNTTSITVEWNGSDDVSIDHYEIQVDGGSWVDVGLNTNYTINSLSEGNHKVSVRAYDSSNNVGEDSVNFTVDLTPPSNINISFVDATSGYWYGGTNRYVNLSVHAEDSKGIDRVEYNVNGTNVSGTLAFIGNNEWNGNFDSKLLSDGNYTIMVYAYDLAGNSNSNSTDVGIDNTPPNMNIIKPVANSNLIRGRTASIEININDLGIGISDGTSCEVSLGTRLLTSNAVYNKTSGICAGTFGIPDDAALGSSTLVVKIADDLNNLGEDTIGINIVNPPAGGGGGGGAPPTNARMNLTIDEDEISMTSDEMININVHVENEGDQYLAGLKMSLSGIPKGNYEFTEPTFNLDKGESKDIVLKIAPINLLSGDYEIKVEASNVIVGDSDSFVLKFTNLKEENATSVCNDAKNYIDELKSNGTNVTSLSSNYDNAMSQINARQFDNAIKTCEGIISYKPSKPPITPPIPPTTPGGITGFFIAAGKFTMNNLVWMLLISAIAIIAFLSRRRLIKFFKKPPTPPMEADKESSENTGENSEEPKDKIYTIIW